MGITGIHCYFVVWTVKELFVEKITLNEKIWQNVKKIRNFLKSFVCPVLALTKYYLKSPKQNTRIFRGGFRLQIRLRQSFVIKALSN